MAFATAIGITYLNASGVMCCWQHGMMSCRIADIADSASHQARYSTTHKGENYVKYVEVKCVEK